ncbi:hypothetical protein BGW36DRAFT_302536 [Talaromyces proteolyticus]|uniref:FAD-binding domain-containing protein n=1 Tax=Talaromyces proteolyticus TaxID=1131652 RepID=A0AAD4KKV1_9EURO|nr:uncharacterized protein BGW36DRAFT_302536 [Talaromyces proteolyticus]KAH8693298.1 hypothetical protein BGW36DRAFT_302536 [Talaromyces proteolyticus]
MGDIQRNCQGHDGPKPPLDVAVVGGGIIGVVTALGFLQRGMNVVIYERAAKFEEIGAAIGFTGVARECMQRLNPRILEVLRQVGQRSPHETVRYWDGFHPRTKESAEQEESSLLFDVPQQGLAFWACLRSHFLCGMVDQLPEGSVQFGKQLVNYTDSDGSEKVKLHFADATTAEADVVIGCDGIHSATRKLLLGKEHPASNPSYSHKLVFRALVSFPGAVAALGADKASDQCLHLGPGAHMVSFPVNNGAMYNIVLAIHDSQEWPDPYTMTATSTREEVSSVMEHWGPHLTEIIGLLPEKLTKYGVFDMAENPAPTYASGRVCIAGDAAHASSPFHGSGACMGVEDALVLSELLDHVQSLPVSARPHSLAAALQAFSTVRIERSQWLVQSSREIGDIYEWRYPDTGEDSAKCKAEFEWRTKKIWDFDVDAMVAESKKEYDKLATSTVY